MKLFYFNALVLVGLLCLAPACTNKKLENNIKSLEKRVAALEGKSGAHPATTLENNVSDAELPVMTFETKEYDFGSINEGDVVDYTFKFTNTGKSPLIINKATATCGCTVPKWPKDPILPGAKGEIQVQFNSENRKNLQTKYVNINANTKPEITRLKITGNVVGADG
ncbi:MAG: DUF1573 domain-containing protein [Cytophagales bacterium]|nr:DUF1573 domain-containing protein [Cytophagales bacterium]